VSPIAVCKRTICNLIRTLGGGFPSDSCNARIAVLSFKSQRRRRELIRTGRTNTFGTPVCQFSRVLSRRCERISRLNHVGAVGNISQSHDHWRNFTLKSGGDQWRRQDLVSGGHDDRGAEGASIDAPKASSLVGYGEGCPLETVATIRSSFCGYNAS